MKLTFRNALLLGITCLAVSLTPTLRADDAKPAAPAAGAEESAKPKVYGFQGEVASVDTAAKTVSLKKKEGARVLKIDSNSKYSVDGKPATLADVKPGLHAHGSVTKENGAEVIVKAKFDTDAPGAKAKKSDMTNAAPAVSAASTNAAPDPTAPDAPKKKKKKKTDTSTNAAPSVN